MAVYTVHEPLPRDDEASASPDRFVFVRDGFYFWAFLLGPLWMLWRRLWLVTVLYFAVSIALQAGLWAVGAPNAARFVVWLLLSLLVGFEAGTLRRWTLARRGWRNVGVVVGDDVESAERRFFTAWTPQAASAAFPPPPAASTSPLVARLPRPGDNQVVGLFPQPGGPR
jgi:hypothetical protein